MSILKEQRSYAIVYRDRGELRREYFVVDSCRCAIEQFLSTRSEWESCESMQGPEVLSRADYERIVRDEQGWEKTYRLAMAESFVPVAVLIRDHPDELKKSA